MSNDTTTNNVAAAVTAGVESANVESRLSTIRGIPVALVPQTMKLEVLTRAIELADQREPAPARRRGTSTHDEVASFVEHVNRFKDEHSVIFADIAKTKIQALYNYNQGGADPKAARWGDHRAAYTCPLSKAWLRWTGLNEQWIAQDAFAEFIDAHMTDIANPNEGAIATDIAAPAAVLEMARNLIVRTKGEFQRTVNVTTGEMTLISKTENETTSTKIHRAFFLGIPVFEAGVAYRIEARIRFNMNNGRPAFMYSLVETDRVLRDAFDGVRTVVREQTGLPLFAGSPE